MTMLVALFAAGMAAQLPDNASTPLPRQIQLLVNEYADCVVKNEHGSASAAILSDAPDQDLMRSYPQLLQEHCVPTRLGEFIRVGFTATQMRNAIAEALVRRDLSAVPAPVLDDVPALVHSRVGEMPTMDAQHRTLSGRHAAEVIAAYKQAQVAQYLSRYGECVVRVGPSAAKSLLLTEQGTAAEAEAFHALETPLGTCLAEGRTLNFNKASLRGTIAINYYRLAIAAQKQALAGTK